MCLEYNIEKAQRESGTGYKVFKKYKGGLIGSYSGGKIRLAGQWLKAEDYPPTKLGMSRMLRIDNRYEPMWHIFPKASDAYVGFSKCYPKKKCKVKYRGATFEGGDNYYRPVIVAKEIYIYPEKKQKEK